MISIFKKLKNRILFSGRYLCYIQSHAGRWGCFSGTHAKSTTPPTYKNVIGYHFNSTIKLQFINNNTTINKIVQNDMIIYV